MGRHPLLSVLSPQQLSRSQVSPGGQLGGQVGKGGLWPCPRPPVGLAATTWLPEEGQVVLAQDSASPR